MSPVSARPSSLTGYGKPETRRLPYAEHGPVSTQTPSYDASATGRLVFFDLGGATEE